jgi:hypothetical protein
VITEVSPTNWLNVYVRLNGQLFAQYTLGSPRTQFIHSDHLGSTRLVTACVAHKPQDKTHRKLMILGMQKFEEGMPNDRCFCSTHVNWRCIAWIWPGKRSKKLCDHNDGNGPTRRSSSRRDSR